MPTWLAIAIPSVLAVAACSMWGLDYSKKAHEIAKLRLELEKLEREKERSEREERSRASGLYKPTPEEVDMIGYAKDLGNTIRSSETTVPLAPIADENRIRHYLWVAAVLYGSVRVLYDVARTVVMYLYR
jgi:hypothetical protein